MKLRAADGAIRQRGAARPELRSLAKDAAAPASHKRRKILIVASRLHVGGAEQTIANLAAHLDRALYEVAVCYLQENGIIGEQIERDGVELLPLPGRVADRHDRLTSLKLRRLIIDNEIELLHTHDVQGFVDGCICRLAVPRLRHVHTFHFGNYPHRKVSFRYMESCLWRVPDALVAVGHAQAAAIRALYRIPESRLRVVCNGADEPVPQVASAVLNAVSNRQEPVIASISTLIPQKGLEQLLESAAELLRMGITFQLLIIGDGPLREALERRAAELALRDRVQFLGWVPEAAATVIPACDVLVQSSLWEAMSILVLEAMACGKPVVVTDVGDNKRMVLDKQTGLVVPARDPLALAQALRALLLEPSLRARYGKAARERHAQNFTIRHMSRRYEDLYGELLQRQRRARP
jgi:glycosyltransferase involved in cell wall biosynthesis